MNRQELINEISQEAEVSKAVADRMLSAFINAVQDAVAAKDKVTLVGFGSFEQVATSARTGRNPQTGETIQIAAGVRPKFTAGAKFKEAVKSGK